MAQGGAGKHDQWRGYMTVLVITHVIINSSSILTVVICPMIEFDAEKLQDCFRQEVNGMLAIR